MILLPDDASNRALLENAHPPGWKSPQPAARYDLVVLGGGTAGLVSALGGAGLGARVALVEKHLLGGDCLNFGCVPSKGVIRAARAVEAIREAGKFGIRSGASRAVAGGGSETDAGGGWQVDFAAVMARMREQRARISANDSAQRLADHGVDVFLGEARFVAPDAVEVEGRRLRFVRAVVATGGRAAVPSDVPGLLEAGFLTNETVFSLTALPRRLAVIGGGPIGCELAQAFQRLGSEVTVIGRDAQLLPREDPDAAAILDRKLRAEGVRLELGVKLLRVEPDRTLVFTRDGHEGRAPCDAILVAAGRAPNVEGLGLDLAGISVAKRGVQVDDHLRTTNPRVFAVGDVASRFQFTHAADALARIALQNAFFFGRKKESALVMPWCTYTDPEIAHVGLTAREAQERGAQTFTVPLAEVDRAVLDGETDGFARLHAGKGGRILGGTLVSRHAGETIGEVSLAITAGLSMADLASTIHPYPTQAEALKRAADAWSRTRLTPRVQGILKRLIRMRR